MSKKENVPQKRFEIKKWNAVAIWKYDIDVENCSICRNDIVECCIECTIDPTKDVEECNISWGVCGHAYHRHCISRWLNTKNTCPLDSRPWDYDRFESRKHVK